MNMNNFSGTVLVVDDEPFVLRTTAVVLSNIGFSHVQTVDNVEGALGIIAKADPPVELVLCDLNMPEVDGLELLKRFDEQKYRGEIILFSGEDSQTLKMAENLAHARNLSVIGAIAKPIQVESLAALISNHPNQNRPATRKSKSVVVTPEMLEKAINNGEIEPWFQPKIEIKSRNPIGVEALARWPNSIHGPIFPDAFIPVAEEHGLIDELTFLMFEKVFKIEKQWRAQGLDLKIAVNLSMDSLNNPDFSDRLNSLLSIEMESCKHLQLEVTESRLMEDMVRPLEELLRLRMKKIILSIDDFGTGHSNFSQLRDLPFDELKLDQSFVSHDAQSERTTAILESSVAIAKKLEMTIVAEGVETLEEWQRVESLGCDQVQGYFVAKAMPGSEIATWVASWPQQKKKLFGASLEA